MEEALEDEKGEIIALGSLSLGPKFSSQKWTNDVFQSTNVVSLSLEKNNGKLNFKKLLILTKFGFEKTGQEFVDWDSRSWKRGPQGQVLGSQVQLLIALLLLKLQL